MMMTKSREVVLKPQHASESTGIKTQNAESHIQSFSLSRCAVGSRMAFPASSYMILMAWGHTLRATGLGYEFWQLSRWGRRKVLWK